MSLPAFSPPDAGIARPFWDAADRSELVLPRCSACGTWQWYPSAAGTCCQDGLLDWVPVSGRGSVHTYTYVRRPFLPGGAEHIPFAVVFVDIDEAPGVRLVGNLVDDSVEPTIGMHVDIEFVTVDGRRRPAFRPTSEDIA